MRVGCVEVSVFEDDRWTEVMVMFSAMMLMMLLLLLLLLLLLTRASSVALT